MNSETESILGDTSTQIKITQKELENNKTLPSESNTSITHKKFKQSTTSKTQQTTKNLSTVFLVST